MTGRTHVSISHEHLELLTPAERDAVVLYQLGWGYRRIAKHLGISMTSVRDRLERATRRIADIADYDEGQETT